MRNGSSASSGPAPPGASARKAALPRTRSGRKHPTLPFKQLQPHPEASGRATRTQHGAKRRTADHVRAVPAPRRAAPGARLHLSALSPAQIKTQGSRLHLESGRAFRSAGGAGLRGARQAQISDGALRSQGNWKRIPLEEEFQR